MTDKMVYTINDLLETNKPLHPTELERAGLTYMCRFGNLECYKNDKGHMYTFKDDDLEPFLNFYYLYKDEEGLL